MPPIIRTTFEGKCGQVRTFNRHYNPQQNLHFHSIRKKRYQYNSFKEEYCRKKKWEGQRGGGEDSCCCKDEFHPREWRDLRPAEVRIRRGGPAGHHPQGVSVGALLWRRGRGTEEVPLSLSSQTETVRILERRETQAFKFSLPD